MPIGDAKSVQSIRPSTAPHLTRRSSCWMSFCVSSGSRLSSIARSQPLCQQTLFSDCAYSHAFLFFAFPKIRPKFSHDSRIDTCRSLCRRPIIFAGVQKRCNPRNDFEICKSRIPYSVMIAIFIEIHVMINVYYTWLLTGMYTVMIESKYWYTDYEGNRRIYNIIR